MIRGRNKNLGFLQHALHQAQVLEAADDVPCCREERNASDQQEQYPQESARIVEQTRNGGPVNQRVLWKTLVPVPDEVNDHFLAGRRTDQVRFAVNDRVRITAGPHAKRTGAVVSVLTIEPETTFLVEPSEAPWGDLQISQSKLELIE